MHVMVIMLFLLTLLALIQLYMDRKIYGNVVIPTCNRLQDILEIWEAGMGVAIGGGGVILDVCNNEVALSWVLSNLLYRLIKNKTVLLEICRDFFSLLRMEHCHLVN